MPKSKSRKILYSPGFGAGWTTWEHNPEIKAYMLEYKPIIDFLETGGKFKDEDCHSYKDGPLHPLLEQLKKDCKEKFGEDYIYCGGADDLEVMEVSGRVRIEEYDGSESVVEEGDDERWL